MQYLLLIVSLTAQQSPAAPSPVQACRQVLVDGYHTRAIICLDALLQEQGAGQGDRETQELAALAKLLADASPRRGLVRSPSTIQKKPDPALQNPIKRRRPIGAVPLDPFVTALQKPPLQACTQLLVAGQEQQAAGCFDQASVVLPQAALRQSARRLSLLALDMAQSRRQQSGDQEAALHRIVTRQQNLRLRKNLALLRSIGFVGINAAYGGFLGSHLGRLQRDLSGLGAGLGALGGATLGLFALKGGFGFHPKDLVLVESGLFVGGLNGLFLDVTLTPMLHIGSNLKPGEGWVLAASVAPVLLSVGLAQFVDLPQGGPRLASSLAFWGAGLYSLGRLAGPPGFLPIGIGMTAMADAAYVGGLLLAPWWAPSRDQVWAMDAGAVLMGLGAYALSSPWLYNSKLHAGLTASGVVLGAGLGLGLGWWARDWLVPAKLRDIQPLMLSLAGPELSPGPLRHWPAQESGLRGLAVGLRWQGDLSDALRHLGLLGMGSE